MTTRVPAWVVEISMYPSSSSSRSLPIELGATVLVPRKARDHLAEGVQLDRVDPNVIGMNHRRVGERGRGVDARETGFSVHLGLPPTDGRRSSRSRADQHLGFTFRGVLGGENLAHRGGWCWSHSCTVGDQVLGSGHAWIPFAGVGRQLAAEDEMKMRLQDR